MQKYLLVVWVKKKKKRRRYLNQTSSIFSKLVAKQLNTKYSPKLSFFVDFSFSQAEKINSLNKYKITSL